MSEFGEFFFDGVEICNVTDEGWDLDFKTETVSVYKNARNDGTISRGNSEEITQSISCIDLNPRQEELLINTVRAINDSNNPAPLVFNYKDRSYTFTGANTAKLSYKGESEKGRNYGMDFKSTGFEPKYK